jgi:hypothetical protein
MPDEVVTPEVSLAVNEGLTETKEGQDDPEKGVENVDDLTTGPEGETGEKPLKKEEKEEKETPADKGGKKVGDDPELVKMRAEKEQLKKDLHNLRVARRQEREKAAGKESKEDAVLTDEQLTQILRDNPDPETQLRVARYVANLEANKKAKATLADVKTSQHKATMDNLLTERFPFLFEDGSEFRADIDKLKDELGLSDHPHGDFYAVGTRILENLPTLLNNAFKDGQKAALSKKADENRGKSIKDSDLTPKGKQTGKTGDEGITKEQRESASQMNLTPSQRKIYASLVGKKPRTISVQEEG